LGTGGGRSGVGGGGGGLVPGTGSGGGGGSLTNDDRATRYGEDVGEGEDAQRREDHEESTDKVRRKAVPGEDRRTQE